MLIHQKEIRVKDIKESCAKAAPVLALALLLGQSASLAQTKRAASVPAQPDAFKKTLTQIITAAERDHLESLLGRRAPVPDPEASWARYLPKVILPGLDQCRIEDHDLGRKANGSNQEIRPEGAELVYTCTLVDAQSLTSGVSLAYERLVDRVKRATGLPSTSSEGGLFKTEPHPGSGVFVSDRKTVFSPDGRIDTSYSGPGPDYTWLDVSLKGSMGGWRVTLSVHAPPYLMSYARERQAAEAELARLAAEQARMAADQRAKGYWVDNSTRLMWTGKDAGTDVGWEAAVSYCRDLSRDGRLGWRLPEIDELEKLDMFTVSLSGDIRISGWTEGTIPQRLRLAMGIWTATKQPSGDPWVFHIFSGHRENGTHNAERVLCVHSLGQ